MPTPPNLHDLLDRWEELRDRGQNPSAPDLCRETPELLPELQKAIAVLQAMDQVLNPGASALPGPDEPTPLPPARPRPRLPGYELHGTPRRGRLTKVYQASHLASGRTVAVKVIRNTFDPATVRRFLNQVKSLTQPPHPDILPVLEAGEHDGNLYVVTEFVSGDSLARQLRGQPWPPAQAATIVKNVAETVQAAHDRGLLHLDLMPGNLFPADDGTVKVGDFGLNWWLWGELGSAAPEALPYTPGYAAPELVAGKVGAISAATDVFGLGAILYELLAGRPPFPTHGAGREVLTEEPAPPSRWQPGLARDLEAICRRCLERAPRHRYLSAGEVAADLGRFRRGEKIHSARLNWTVRAWRRLRTFWKSLLLGPYA
jgi:serine/threonine-protein kinase